MEKRKEDIAGDKWREPLWMSLEEEVNEKEVWRKGRGRRREEGCGWQRRRRRVIREEQGGGEGYFSYFIK